MSFEATYVMLAITQIFSTCWDCLNTPWFGGFSYLTIFLTLLVLNGFLAWLLNEILFPMAREAAGGKGRIQ